MRNRKKIVVGVDGSLSANVLAWAASEAVLRSCDLEVVHAASLKAVAFASPGAAMMLRNADLHAVGTTLLRDALDELAEMPAVVTTNVVDDDAADALLRAAADAEMLVLGSRAKDLRGTIRFRPTHQQCLRHATCPVLIVPEET